MPLHADDCDRVVDPHFSKLVLDVQLAVSGITQRMEQLLLQEEEAVHRHRMQLQQIQMPDVDPLCQQIRSSGDELADRLNESLKQLMTSITASVSIEMRRVMRNMADECVKKVAENARSSQCDDGDRDWKLRQRQQVDTINRCLRNISLRLFSLSQQNEKLTQMERRQGLKVDTEARNRALQQVLHSPLWPEHTLPDRRKSPEPAPFPDLAAASPPPEPQPQSSPTAGKPAVRAETPHSATKDRTFAEILTDRDSGSKKWETKRQSGL